MLLGYSDSELANMGGYDLVHYDDLAYVASAHQECKMQFRKLYIEILNPCFSAKNRSFWNDSVQIAD